MKGLGERILTTHVGSLVRPPALLEMIIDRVAGSEIDEAQFEALVTQSVEEVVAKQAQVGVDIPSDGEFSKSDFHSYIVRRLGGLGVRPSNTGGFDYPKLVDEFPGFMKQYNSMYRTMWLPPEISRDKAQAAMNASPGASIVERPITYEGRAELQRDLDNLRAATAGHDFADIFVPSATPSRDDAFSADVYKSGEEYLYALADAMHEEYQAIVDAGFMVQLDLGLPSRNQVLPGIPNPSPEDLRRASEMQVEAYNHALRGIPPERDIEASGMVDLGSERLFCDMKPDGRPGHPDGMKCDIEGNVYCTGPGGIWVLDPAGKQIGTILSDVIPINMAWGDDDWSTLYFTGLGSLNRVRLGIPGVPVPRGDL